MILKTNYLAPEAELLEIRTSEGILAFSDTGSGNADVDIAIYHNNEGWD